MTSFFQLFLCLYILVLTAQFFENKKLNKEHKQKIDELESVIKSLKRKYQI